RPRSRTSGVHAAATGSRGSRRAAGCREDPATTTRPVLRDRPASGTGRCDKRPTAFPAPDRRRRRRSRFRRPLLPAGAARASAVVRQARSQASHERCHRSAVIDRVFVTTAATASAQQAPRDLTYLDLVGAGVDLEYLGLPRELLDLVLGHVPLAAEGLD